MSRIFSSAEPGLQLTWTAMNVYICMEEPTCLTARPWPGRDAITPHRKT